MKQRSSFRTFAFDAMLDEEADRPADNHVCPLCARDFVKGECPVHGEPRRLAENERVRQPVSSK